MTLDAKIVDLTSQFVSEKEDLKRIFSEEKLKKEVTEKNRHQMMKNRGNKDEKITKRNTK